MGYNGLLREGYDDKGNSIIECDKEYFRPLEVDTLLGDPTKARKELNWKPTVNFESLVEMMVDHDLKRVEKGLVWF